MDRYTKRENSGNAVIRGDGIYSDGGTPEGFKGDAIDRLAAYEDMGLEPEEIIELVDRSEITPQQEYFINEKADSIITGLKELLSEVNERNHMTELLKAEAEGRLLVLPCKVGDTVYYIDGYKSYKVKVHTFKFNESGVRVYCERNFMECIGFEGIYGKTVFLTHEEAEAALRKGVDEK